MSPFILHMLSSAVVRFLDIITTNLEDVEIPHEYPQDKSNSMEISTDYLWNMTLVSTVILWISHTNILDITIHSSDKSTEADCILHNMPTIYT